MTTQRKTIRLFNPTPAPPPPRPSPDMEEFRQLLIAWFRAVGFEVEVDIKPLAKGGGK